MKHKEQFKTAPLNRAADLLAEKSSSFPDKTARQINAPFVPEIHMVGGDAGQCDAIGELFKACGWVVIYEPGPKSASEIELESSLYEPHKEMAKSPRRGLQPRAVRQPKGTRKRSKV
jgi:hypothetical protein